MLKSGYCKTDEYNVAIYFYNLVFKCLLENN